MSMETKAGGAGTTWEPMVETTEGRAACVEASQEGDATVWQAAERYTHCSVEEAVSAKEMAGDEAV